MQTSDGDHMTTIITNVSVSSLLRTLLLLFIAPLVIMAMTTTTSYADEPPAGTAAGEAHSAISANIENSVVKIFSTVRYPDPYRPWSKREPTEITGSGVVIEGNRILTNAHVVLYASQVQIQANQAGDKLLATVEAIAPGIDLAVLKLDDNSFFKTHAPLARATTLPSIKDAVLAYGYPTGGTSLSITKGIVSRIEFVPYSIGMMGLRIQIDAAINPGNSGGPAVVGDKMIGLSFSKLNDAENIGYIIPNEEIDLFLKDIADGHYDGKPALHDDLQTLENADLRSFLKLNSDIHGVVVHRPYSGITDNPLKEWDIITRIGDSSIDDQGMIILNSDVRVNFRYRIQQLAKQGKLPLTIVRNGHQLNVSMPVSLGYPFLIPDVDDKYPSYFIYGPLVFSKVTRLYLAGYSKSAKDLTVLTFIGSPLITQFSAMATPEREELVVIAAPFFPHKLSKGYSSPQSAIVYSVNGTPVSSLKHLVTLLRNLKDEYVVFQLEPHMAETLVFNRKDMLAATDGILNDNGIRSQGSPELMAVWQSATDQK